ncbi:MAG: hypothetical protein GXP54_12755 [Deltaproteobacteria bacterium]|nr:hypothetical protein [Deltaproteobacteria bacterium]
MRLLGMLFSLSFVVAVAVPAWSQVRDERKVAPRIQMMGEKKEENAKKRTGIVITSNSSEWDKVADEAGQIYVSRGYKGVVPGVRDTSAVSVKNAKPDQAQPTRPVLEWVGFQPFATYSRVFLQLKGPIRFNVTKPKPDRIVLKLPGTDISTANDQRFLNTSEFPTAVNRVTIQQTGEGEARQTIVSIFLKKPVGYLYRHEGDYIFVDVGL